MKQQPVDKRRRRSRGIKLIIALIGLITALVQFSIHVVPLLFR